MQCRLHYNSDGVMEIAIKKAGREDAPIIAQAVAMAIGEESVAEYCGENYLAVLEEIAGTQGTQYSYANSLVAFVDGEPAGAIVGYDGAMLYPLRENTLSIVGKYNPAVPHLPDETSQGEFYLDSLGVLPHFRGCGVASALIRAICSVASEAGCGRVGLIVEKERPLVEKLYASLGFRRVGTKEFLGHPMWHMQMELTAQ